MLKLVVFEISSPYGSLRLFQGNKYKFTFFVAENWAPYCTLYELNPMGAQITKLAWLHNFQERQQQGLTLQAGIVSVLSFCALSDQVSYLIADFPDWHAMTITTHAWYIPYEIWYIG